MEIVAALPPRVHQPRRRGRRVPPARERADPRRSSTYRSGSARRLFARDMAFEVDDRRVTGSARRVSTRFTVPDRSSVRFSTGSKTRWRRQSCAATSGRASGSWSRFATAYLPSRSRARRPRRRSGGAREGAVTVCCGVSPASRVPTARRRARRDAAREPPGDGFTASARREPGTPDYAWNMQFRSPKGQARHADAARACRHRIIPRHASTSTTHMPIYEYECQKCARTVRGPAEAFRQAAARVPRVRAAPVEAAGVRAPLFRLAGSGWYETDFKSDKERKRNILEKGEKEPAAPLEAKEAVPAKKETVAEAPAKPRTMVTKPAKAGAGSAQVEARGEEIRRPGTQALTGPATWPFSCPPLPSPWRCESRAGRARSGTT